MNWNVRAFGLKVPQPNEGAESEPHVDYRWAVGRIGQGAPKESQHIYEEAAPAEPDLHRIARLLRGEKR